MEAAQRGGAGVFAPQLHPGVFLGFFPPFPRGARIDFQDGAADRGPDIPRVLAVEVRDDEGLGGGRARLIQDRGGAGDHVSLVQVDAAFFEGAAGQRQAGGQVIGQVELLPGRPSRQCERSGDLIGAVFAPWSGVSAAGGGLPADRGPPPAQLGHCRKFPRPRPGLQLAPGQHAADQLIIGQARVVAAGPGGILGEPRQSRARQAGLQHPAGRKPAPPRVPGPATRQKPHIDGSWQQRIWRKPDANAVRIGQVVLLGGFLRRPPRFSAEVAGGHRATVLPGRAATGLPTVLGLAAVLPGLRAAAYRARVFVVRPGIGGRIGCHDLHLAP